jgi:hypothetical protein
MTRFGKLVALMLLLTALSSGAATSLGAKAGPTFKAPPGSVLEGARSGPNVFAAGGIGKECDEADFEGTIGAGATSLELQPIYGTCTAKALTGLPAKFVWSECVYLLHDLERIGGGRWQAAVDIACPPSLYMEWNVYESEAEYESGQTLCITNVPPQKGIGTAELRNLRGSRGGIAIRWDLSGIEYSVLELSLVCGSPPGSVRHDAWYRGDSTVTAKDAKGRFVDLAVVD